MRVVLVFPLLLVLTGFLSWFAGYVTHCFFHVLNETAQGRNEVPIRWPSEGYYERLWTAGYLLALLTLAFLPAFFLVRLLGLLLGDSGLHSLLVVLLVAVVLWLFLPVLLLSVLSSRHHWEIVRGQVLRVLAQNAAMTGSLYGASLPIVVVGLLVIHFAVASWTELREAASFSTTVWLADAVEYWSWLVVLPLTAAMGGAAILIYARLLGRLAWLLDLAEAEESLPPANPAVPAPADFAVSHDALEPAVPPADVPLEIYGLQQEEPDSALPAGPIPEREIPFTVTVPAARPFDPIVPIALAPIPDKVLPSPILEIPATPSAPRRLLVRGIFLFPWYRGSLAAWIMLTLGGLFTLLLARLMVLVWV